MTERLFGSKEDESGAGTEETRPPLRSSGPSVDSRTYPESGEHLLYNAFTKRGVWKAPWRGPNDEVVLLAIDADGRLVTDPVTIPIGADHEDVAFCLWQLLDEVDSENSGVIGRAPRMRLFPPAARFLWKRDRHDLKLLS